MDFDEILENTGSFGFYQKSRFFMYCISSTVLCSFVWLKHIFIIYSPEHWCNVPMVDTAHQYNMTVQEWKDLTIPIEMTPNFVLMPSKCQMYNVNFTEILLEHGGKAKANQSWPQIHCLHGWHYDKSIYDNTVVTEWDLVCGRDWLPDFTLSMSIVGNCIGTILFGAIMDRFGRRPSFYICLSWLILFGFVLIFAPNIQIFTLIRTLTSFTIPTSFQITFLLSLEMMSTEKRTFAAMIMCIGWSACVLAFAGIAAAVSNWKTLALVSSLPFIVFYLYAFFLDESPRWLMANKRYEEAEEICQKIAKANKKEQRTRSRSFIREKVFQVKEKEELDPVMTLTVLDLFRTPKMRRTTILIVLNWAVNVIAYIGLTVIVTRLRVNIFLSMCVSGAVEIPSHILPLFILDRLGRKWPLIVSMIVAGIALLCIAGVPYEQMWVSFWLAMVGKFGIAMSFAVLYQFAGELYPTVLRANGLAFGASVGGLAGLLAPQCLYLAKYGQYVPMVIFGGLSLLAGLAILPLPETCGEKLPDTIEQAEAMGKDQSMFYCYAAQGKKAQKRHPDPYKEGQNENGVEMSKLTSL